MPRSHSQCKLQKLLNMRNTAAQFTNAPATSKHCWTSIVGGRASARWQCCSGLTRSNASNGTCTVSITENETPVNVLLMDARRPKRSDLFIEAMPGQLRALFDFLQPDLELALPK